MDYYSALRLLALREVVNASRTRPRDADQYYPLRRIFRAYSEKYHTPLHVVETLPLDDVLQNYWEGQFEDMDREELDAEVARVLQDPERLRQEQITEDERDYWTFQDMEELKREQLLQAAEGMKTTMEQIAAGFKPAPPIEHLSKEPELVSRAAPVVPEGIKMSFSDEDLDLDTESLGGGFGLT